MQTAEIKKTGTRPALFIDGKESVPVSMRSFQPAGRYIREFAQSGCQLFSAFPTGIKNSLGLPYSPFGEVWIGEGEYDKGALEAQLFLLRDNAPEGNIALMVQLDTRGWFLEAHPGCADSFRELIQTVNYTPWRKAAAKWLCDVIDLTEEILPGWLYGIFLMAGGTTEWYTREYHAPTVMQTAAYRAYCKDENAVIPPIEDVWNKASNGILRDEKKEGNEIRYLRFTNASIAEGVLYFAKIAKEHTGGKKVIGAFYGYVGGPCSTHIRNFNAINRVLASPYVDVLFAPASYVYREPENTSAFRMPIDSLTLHGKLYFHEIDCRTHLTQNHPLAALHTIDKCSFQTQEETAAYLRREIGMVLAKGQGFWWFDMFGGYYSSPVMMEEVKKERELAATVLAKNASPLTEVAMVLDLESNYYISGKYFLPESQMGALNRAGAPWGFYLSEDLLHPDFPHDRMKVYLFINAVHPKPEVTAKMEELKREGKTVLVLPPKVPTQPPEPLTEAALRDIYRKAGVCFYTDSTDPIYLNSEMICHNTWLGGKRKLFWQTPAVFEEYFTGETYTLTPEGTEIDMKPRETKILIRKSNV